MTREEILAEIAKLNTFDIQFILKKIERSERRDGTYDTTSLG